MGTRIKLLRSGDVAHLVGVSPDTIRHYERIGILRKLPRADSGYRIYPTDAVERVRMVRRGLQLGFSLAELADILRVRDQGGVPCHRVLTMAEEKLHSLTQQIQELRKTERYMQQLLRQWRAKLANTAPGSHAGLLKSLTDKPKLRARPASNLKGRRS